MWWYLEMRDFGGSIMFYHEARSFMNGITDFIKRSSREVSFHHVKKNKKSGVCNLYNSLTKAWPYWHPDLELPAFQIVRSKLLLFISYPIHVTLLCRLIKTGCFRWIPREGLSYLESQNPSLMEQLSHPYEHLNTIHLHTDTLNLELANLTMAYFFK
jgi:hypothetical protein